MTNKTTMPEPVDYLSCCPETGRPEWSESCVCEDAVFTVEETGTISRAVVFQDQLEAYANARVRAALEEAARQCWLLRCSDEFELEIQDRLLKQAEDRIRALIPTTKKPMSPTA